MAQQISQTMRECIENCTDCANVCLETAAYQIRQTEKPMDQQRIQLLLDCADICRVSAGFMLRGSDLHPTVCQTCAEVCERCADACASSIDDPMMLACAEMCRRCAESCRAMAGGAMSAQHAGMTAQSTSGQTTSRQTYGQGSPAGRGFGGPQGDSSSPQPGRRQGGPEGGRPIGQTFEGRGTSAGQDRSDEAEPWRGGA